MLLSFFTGHLLTLTAFVQVHFGPLKSYLKNEASACKITRNRTARLIGLGWSKVASVDVGVSGVESTGIYPFNRIRVPEIFVLSF